MGAVVLVCSEHHRYEQRVRPAVPEASSLLQAQLLSLLLPSGSLDVELRKVFSMDLGDGC